MSKLIVKYVDSNKNNNVNVNVILETLKNENLKKCKNVIISQRRPVCYAPKQPGTHNASKRCNATDRLWNRYAVFKGLSVASLKRRPSSFKKFVALEVMRLNNLKARGTKWYVIASLTYLVSFLMAASSAAAAAAVIDVDAK